MATIDQEKAVAAATERHADEVEAVKRVPPSDGGAAHELDSEPKGGEGEDDVCVDAECGRILHVAIDDRKIGRPARENEDDDQDRAVPPPTAEHGPAPG